MVNAPPKASELLWLPLVAAALLAIYLPGLGNALVYDDGYLADGELFREYASPFDFRARMLSYGSFVWLQALFGEDWWKQRLFNLLLHGAVVVSLWALYRRILRHIEAPPDDSGEGAPPSYDRSPALGIAIAFFALSPVAVYATGYLIQRSIVMATLFTVLGLWFFMGALSERRPWLHAAALACYALAIMSKEHAILAPLAALPLYILAARPRPLRLGIVATVGSLLVGAAAWVLHGRYGEILGKPFDEYSHVYLRQLSELDPGAGRNPFLLSVINEAWLFFHYGLRWFLPAAEWMSINLRPPFPTSWLAFPHFLGIAGYAAVLVGGFWLVWRHRDWRALAGVSLLIPALLFGTEFTTVWVQDPFVLYRSYLWAIGVPGLVFIAAHGPPPRVLAIAGLVIGALLTWQALDRVRSLATPETAWTDAIRKLPNDARSVGRWFPYLNRGAWYADHNHFNLAMRDFEASRALGDMGMGAFNIGSLLAATGKHAQALVAFDQAEKEGYRLFNLPFQRAQSLLALGRAPEAFRQLQLVASMDPPSPTRELMLLHMGRIKLQMGDREEAIAYLEKLVQLDPRNREGRYVLAMALVSAGRHDRAHALAEELAREKIDSTALYVRALANHGLSRKAQAAADIAEAIRLGGDNQNLRQWQARIQAMP